MNQSQRRQWNDERMVAGWPRRERISNRATPVVIRAARPQPGERFLDIGSGGGKLTLAAAAAVGPSGYAVGADISEPMVRWAEGRVADAGVENASFEVGDMQSAKIPGGPFDAAVSQFGVMFFEDPVAAFRNIRWHLKAGGRLTFICWGRPEKNEWFPGPVLAPFQPPAAPPQPGLAQVGPFAFADPKRSRRILAEAGFDNIVRTPRKLVVRVPEDSIADPSTVDNLKLPPDEHRSATEALEAHYARFRQPDGLSRFEIAVQLFAALRGE